MTGEFGGNDGGNDTPFEQENRTFGAEYGGNIGGGPLYVPGGHPSEHAQDGFEEIGYDPGRLTYDPTASYQTYYEARRPALPAADEFATPLVDDIGQDRSADSGHTVRDADLLSDRVLSNFPKQGSIHPEDPAASAERVWRPSDGVLPLPVQQDVFRVADPVDQQIDVSPERPPKAAHESVAEPVSEEVEVVEIEPEDIQDGRPVEPQYPPYVHPDRPSRSYEKGLLVAHRNIVIVGNNPDLTQPAMRDTLYAAAGYLENDDKIPAAQKVIISVDLGPEPDPYLLRHYDPTRFDLVNVQATGEGLTARLSADQLSAALAAMITPDQEKQAGIRQMLDKITHGLPRHIEDESGRIVEAPPSVAQVKAALNYYTAASRGRRSTELDALTKAQRRILNGGLIGNERAKLWEQQIAAAAAGLEHAYTEEDTRGGVPFDQRIRAIQQAMRIRHNRGESPLPTVIHISMGETAGQELDFTAAQLKAIVALSAIFGKREIWFGEPAGGLYVDNAHFAMENDRLAGPFNHLMNLVTYKRTPSVLSTAFIPDSQTPPVYLRNAVYGITPVDSPSAGMLAKMVGRETRVKYTGVSGGTNYSDSASLGGSTGMNYEPNETFGAGSNTGLNGGAGVNKNPSVTHNYTVGPDDRVQDVDMGTDYIRPGRLGIVGAFGVPVDPSIEGIYRVKTGEKMDIAWPPRDGDDDQTLSLRATLLAPTLEQNQALARRMDTMETLIRAKYGEGAIALGGGSPSKQLALPRPPKENIEQAKPMHPGVAKRHWPMMYEEHRRISINNGEQPLTRMGYYHHEYTRAMEPLMDEVRRQFIVQFGNERRYLPHWPGFRDRVLPNVPGFVLFDEWLSQNGLK